MTTKSGKKVFKNSKSGSSGSKVAAQAPLQPEIDKQKMAAFFSAAGLKGKSEMDGRLKVETVVIKETAVEPASVAPEEKLLSMTETTGPSAAREEEAENSISFPEPLGTDENETFLETANAADGPAENDDASEKGDERMSTADSGNIAKGVSHSGSCSFNLLPVVFILLLAALFWFYYLASTSQEHPEFSRLRSQSAVPENEDIITPGLRRENSMPAMQKDPSFMRAPIPFWQHRQPCSALSTQMVAPAAEKPKVENVDSFSRAPVPFWHKKKAAVKLTPELTAPDSPLSSELKSSLPASMDPSFQRAPKPFWKKN
ncbi:MAG TPA: hypothetical protein ENN66_04485 [Proteobacteria bacterium]|nr:hypothetical protein [Pseudomonadota bacterium]